MRAASRLALVGALGLLIVSPVGGQGSGGGAPTGPASEGGGASALSTPAAQALYATVGIGVIRHPPGGKVRKPGKVVTGPIEDFFPGPRLIARDWPGDPKAFPEYPANYGAGVIFERPNLVLTSARLVRNARGILLFGPFARGTWAEVAVVDTQTGLALLRAKRVLGEGQARPARQGVQVGDDLLVAGCPQALDPSLARPMVSAAGRRLAEAPGVPALQLQGLTSPGYEGAPAFTTSGELVGIVISWPVYLDPFQTLRLPEREPAHFRPAPVSADGQVAFVVPILHPAVWKRLTDLARAVP